MNIRLFRNIGYLSLSQTANYLLPLVTIPYVTRIVGPVNYGLIEWATTLMLFFSAAVIYGFNYTATRHIAAATRNKQELNRIFQAVFYTRLFLFLLVLGLFLVLLLLVPRLREHHQLFLLAFPIVLGWALYPDFLFQGLQRFSVLALANTTVKLLAAALIFTVLREEKDYVLVVAINGFAQVGVALLVLGYAQRQLQGGAWRAPRWSAISQQLRQGWFAFLSHFFVRVYTFGSLIFLGFLLSDVELGLFAAASKLILVGQNFLLMPISGALYPHLAQLRAKKITLYHRAHRRFAWLILGFTGLVCAFVLIFPKFLIGLVFGTDYLDAAPLLQIMAPVYVLGGLSHFALKQGLMVLRGDRWHFVVVVGVGLGSLLINYLLIRALDLTGAAWAKVLIELALALSAWLAFRAWQSRKEAA